MHQEGKLPELLIPELLMLGLLIPGLTARSPAASPPARTWTLFSPCSLRAGRIL